MRTIGIEGLGYTTIINACFKMIVKTERKIQNYEKCTAICEAKSNGDCYEHAMT